ncbi:Amidase [Aspergillus sp. HF37]|nr:Amidase [Aspergillus sp. HF37]
MYREDKHMVHITLTKTQWEFKRQCRVSGSGTWIGSPRHRDGSILYPGSVNNVVGLKPTVGLTSRYMVVPASQRMDTIGPIARTVKEAAKVLQAISGVDPNDNYTLATPFSNGLLDYSAACKLSGLRGKRIGIPRNVIDKSVVDLDPAVLSAFEDAISVMSTARAEIIEDTNFTAYSEYLAYSGSQKVIAVDFKTDLAEYLSNLRTNPNAVYDLKDVRNFTWHCPLEEYPSRDTRVWDAVLSAGIDNTSPEFWHLYQRNLYHGGEGGVLGALSRHNLDAVILPTQVAPGIPALVGSPAITVPLGSMPDGSPILRNRRGNLIRSAPSAPFGISFLGDRWNEETLIAMAYAFEQRTHQRQKIRRYIEPETELIDVV